MNKSNELVIFTHNDLDALGSMLNIEYKFPNIEKKYFFTNYGNLDKIADEIEDYILSNNIKHIIMADVSFATNKDALRRIYNLMKDNYIIHIDHHEYPDNFWDEFPKMKVIHDKSKCAAKLCNEFFQNTGKNKNLDKLTYLTDVYDIWQSKNKHFDIAQSLNDYFWTYDITILKDKIINNNYKLPGDFFQVTANIKKTYEAEIQNYEKRNLIHRFNDITVAFVDEFFNPILIKEMKNGQNFVINSTTWGLVKVRINNDVDLCTKKKKQIMKEITGSDDIGHENAFTYKIQDKINFERIMEEIKHVVNVITEIRR